MHTKNNSQEIIHKAKQIDRHDLIRSKVPSLEFFSKEIQEKIDIKNNQLHQAVLNNDHKKVFSLIKSGAFIDSKLNYTISLTENNLHVPLKK